MDYSKVKKMKVINFRCIGTVEVDFADCPIVALTGSNESGKSSFIRAFGAVAGNLWRTKQNQYIRTGTDGFAVLLELEDGTKIMRKKTSDVNGYTLVTPDGSRRDATKIATDVPDYVEAVMGMFRDPETGESLQVRTYDDPLLFVSTTDGQNYKAMHNAINNLDVREATIAAKADAARLSGEVEKKRGEVEVYNRQLSELPMINTEYLTVILSAVERASVVSVVYDNALRALEVTKTLDGDSDVKKLKKCKMVDTSIFRDFTEAMRHLAVSRVAAVASCDGAETVNSSQYSLFEHGRNLLASVKAHAMKEVPVDVVTISDKVLPLFEKARQAVLTASEASVSYEKLMTGIAKVSVVLRDSGMQVVTCAKCGNDIVVPVGE